MSEKIKLHVKGDDNSEDKLLNVEEKEESGENTKNKKKPKSAVKESDSEEDSKHMKPKQKSNIEKTDSEDNTNHNKKAKKDSKIESGVGSSDVEKAEIESLTADPMKDISRMKLLKKIISHLCLLVLVLGVKNVCLALIAYFFYEDKNHLVLFGSLCIIQVIGAPVGWVAIKMGNRCLFLICLILNLIWIISVISLLVYYYCFNKSPYFNQEIALHVGAIFLLIVSTTLAICCFLMMKHLHMLSVQYKKPAPNLSA